jgi:hypothetical protein
MTATRWPVPLGTFRNQPSLGPQLTSWMEHFLCRVQEADSEIRTCHIDDADHRADVQIAPLRLADSERKSIFGYASLHTDGRLLLGDDIRVRFLSGGLLAAVIIAEADPLAPVRFDHWAEEGEYAEIGDWTYHYRPGEPVGVGA